MSWKNNERGWELRTGVSVLVRRGAGLARFQRDEGGKAGEWVPCTRELLLYFPGDAGVPGSRSGVSYGGDSWRECFKRARADRHPMRARFVATVQTDPAPSSVFDLMLEIMRPVLHQASAVMEGQTVCGSTEEKPRYTGDFQQVTCPTCLAIVAELEAGGAGDVPSREQWPPTRKPFEICGAELGGPTNAVCGIGKPCPVHPETDGRPMHYRFATRLAQFLFGLARFAGAPTVPNDRDIARRLEASRAALARRAAERLNAEACGSQSDRAALSSEGREAPPVPPEAPKGFAEYVRDGVLEMRREGFDFQAYSDLIEGTAEARGGPAPLTADEVQRFRAMMFPPEPPERPAPFTAEELQRVPSEPFDQDAERARLIREGRLIKVVPPPMRGRLVRVEPVELGRTVIGTPGGSVEVLSIHQHGSRRCRECGRSNDDLKDRHREDRWHLPDLCMLCAQEDVGTTYCIWCHERVDCDDAFDHDFCEPDEETGPAAVKTCRECGCTELDCSGCIRRTGVACHWVEADLCSACKELH